MKKSYRALLPLVLFLAACTPPSPPQQQSNRIIPPAADPATQETERTLQVADNLRKGGDAAGAVKLLLDADAKHPNNPEILRKLGYALIAANSPEQAIITFDQLIAQNPDDADAYNGKAVAFDHAGNHLAAQDLYQQALKLSPDSVNIRNNLGMSLILNDQPDQAIALLEPLAQQPGAGKTVRQNLALAYGLRGDKEKAMTLNLKDMPPEEARDNMHFYEQYASKHRHEQIASATATSSIGFAETPATARSKDDPESDDNGPDAYGNLSPSAGSSISFGAHADYSYPQSRH